MDEVWQHYRTCERFYAIQNHLHVPLNARLQHSACCITVVVTVVGYYISSGFRHISRSAIVTLHQYTLAVFTACSRLLACPTWYSQYCCQSRPF